MVSLDFRFWILESPNFPDWRVLFSAHEHFLLRCFYLIWCIVYILGSLPLFICEELWWFALALRCCSFFLWLTKSPHLRMLAADTHRGKRDTTSHGIAYDKRIIFFYRGRRKRSVFSGPGFLYLVDVWRHPCPLFGPISYWSFFKGSNAIPTAKHRHPVPYHLSTGRINYHSSQRKESAPYLCTN